MQHKVKCKQCVYHNSEKTQHLSPSPIIEEEFYPNTCPKLPCQSPRKTDGSSEGRQGGGPPRLGGMVFPRQVQWQGRPVFWALGVDPPQRNSHERRRWGGGVLQIGRSSAIEGIMGDHKHWDWVWKPTGNQCSSCGRGVRWGTTRASSSLPSVMERKTTCEKLLAAR